MEDAGIVAMERAINVLTDVKDLSEWLKGSRVDEAKLEPSTGQLAFTLELTRAMTERQTRARQGLFMRTKTPWIRCRLTLHHIGDARIKRLTDQAPNDTPLLTCEAVKGGYQLTVQAEDGLQFILNLDQLDGTFTDVGSPIDAP